MAVVEQKQSTAGTVVKVKDARRGESMWADAWKRLSRNRAALIGMIIIIVNIVVAIFAPQLAPRDYQTQVLADHDAAPRWVLSLFPSMKARDEGGYVTVSDDYPLGADALGRDILSRIIYGTRISLAVAFIGPAVSMLVGLIVGMLAGYLGGRVDNILMRVVDLMYAFPTLLLIILLMTFFRTGFAAPQPGTFAFA